MTRTLQFEANVPAPLDDVWAAWTTPAGLQTFFAPETNVELAVGGPFEILFFPDEPLGRRGSEGCKVLSYLPERMLSFSWNAPPQFPAIRDGGPSTWVVVQLQPAGDQTRVALTHLGWGQGGDWDGVYVYFDDAWKLVLGRLEHRFASGPIDWSDPWRPEG